VRGGKGLHVVVAVAYGLMAYNLWSQHKAKLTGVSGLTDMVDIWYVFSPVRFCMG
jgi:hypothetical protein